MIQARPATSATPRPRLRSAATISASGTSAKSAINGRAASSSKPPPVVAVRTQATRSSSAGKNGG